MRGLPDDRRGISVIYNKVAGLREKQGDLAGAEELYTKSLAIREQLTEERGTIQDYDDLAVSCYRLAKLSAVPLERRRALAKRGMDIGEQLYEKTHLPRHKQIFDLCKWIFLNL